MNVAGIDVSSHAVDVVWVDLDDLASPEWRRWELVGKDAWERCRHIGAIFPGPISTMWEDTTAFGVEVAFGPSSGAVNRCVGAVLSRLPHDVLVEPWPPAKWRKAVGLPGNASKEDVADWVISYGPTHADPTENRCGRLGCWCCTWEQDTFDAYCLALATRKAITRKQAA